MQKSPTGQVEHAACEELETVPIKPLAHRQSVKSELFMALMVP
jgi:hypothetical protein